MCFVVRVLPSDERVGEGDREVEEAPDDALHVVIRRREEEMVARIKGELDVD